MEQDDWFGFGIGCVTEVIEVAIWTHAADDLGAWRGVDGQPLSADWDFAIVTDPDGILLAPDGVRFCLWLGVWAHSGG